MCRLLGIVASERTHFQFTLHTAPRSLASLSGEHPHGWGIGIYDAPAGWTVHKRPVRASECDAFYAASSNAYGELLLAHVRARTVGQSSLPNTHPFRRERWLFAHNGTLTDTGFIRANTSPARLAQIEGETDSELLFSYLLTRLDEAGLSGAAVSEETDRVLHAALRAALAHPLGACNFLFSDGNTLYAHRSGRTLFLLEKRPTDAVRVHRASPETGATVDTPWSADRHAVLIASERMTDEPWQELSEGTLLRCDRAPRPAWRVLGQTIS